MQRKAEENIILRGRAGPVKAARANLPQYCLFQAVPQGFAGYILK
jgi:hypothetical protein